MNQVSSNNGYDLRTYMRSIVTDRVAWSAGLSVCHNSEPCKNG